MTLSFELIKKDKLTDEHRKIFADLLKKQGKVKGILIEKADRCKLICITKVNNKPVAIGAIKKKTLSDFNKSKANLPELADLFDWELGYFYTSETVLGKGIANQIAKLLTSEFKEENLMATTELSTNPAMVKILLRNGFELFGNPFKSGIHNNILGLYLKFGKKTA